MPNNKYNTNLKKCPNSPGVYSGIKIDGKGLYVGRMSCNSWNCPYCHPRLKKKLYKRIFGGALSDEVFTTKKHSLKFLTLTCPGVAFRRKFSPIEAYEEMVVAFDRLIKYLKGKHGHFHYFRVCEVCNGYPHFHILFAGDNIVPIELLLDIKWNWEQISEMGFVKLNSKLKESGFNNVKHAINYMLKYITKDIRKVGRNKRIFTCSRGALLKVDKLKYKSMLVHLGSVHSEASKIPDNFREIDFSDQIIKLKGWAHDCISTGFEIIELRDFMEVAQQTHFDRLMGVEYTRI